MIVETKRNVFISHINEDDHRLEPLKDLLRRSGMEVSDGSIHSGKPNDAHHEGYIKSEILTPRINWASTLIVLISEETKHSEWVNWEIECAERLGKRIVGVWDHGASEADLPEALNNCADAVVVGWQGQKIIDAIEGVNNDIETPAGEVIATRPLPRYSC